MHCCLSVKLTASGCAQRSSLTTLISKENKLIVFPLMETLRMLLNQQKGDVANKERNSGAFIFAF